MYITLRLQGFQLLHDFSKTRNEVPIEPQQQHLLDLVGKGAGSHVTNDVFESGKIPLSLTASGVDACVQPS